ncbi:MAG: hypothetical protein QG635_570 [Bacteroidota bacterium]|nr:hypothetical protein [Bacteroidota bacterium]
MKKFILLSILFLSALAFSVSHSEEGANSFNSEKPKLIIGIVVDQMGYDYIGRYKNKFTENGFNKLLSKGFVCRNANFEHFPTYTGPGHAVIYTGTNPAQHGIAANEWADKSSGKLIYCTYDSLEYTIGSNTESGKMSPRNLLVTTITDRLKFTSNFKSKIIGISLKDRAAILPAGHFADAAYWYDGASKNWITSTYYMKFLPKWVLDFNAKSLPDKYLSQDWNTLLPINEYTASTADENNYESAFKGEQKPVFPHLISKLTSDKYLLQSTPFGNSITKDFAIETLKNEHLGKDEITDFLSISFSSTDYVGHKFGPNSIETEDTYLRLDRDIEELLMFIDEFVGIENTLIFLTADHGNAPNPILLKDHKLDAGTFYFDTIKNSCNYYLQKTFQAENIIMQVINQQIYLNQNSINSFKLCSKTIEDSICSFLIRTFPEMNGAYPSRELGKCSVYDNIAKRFYAGYYPMRCGDIYFSVKPYWLEEKVTGTTHGSHYSYDRHVPLVWFGWKVKPGETSAYFPITSIAASLAGILNITVGEQADEKPILELLEKLKK